METLRWMFGLMAILLLVSSCATIDDAKSSFKKTFPGRDDNRVTTDNNVRK